MSDLLHLTIAAERDKLAAFKAYVHKRLDDAGVPTDPESSHKAEGCRIGGRLDVVLAERHALAAENARLAGEAERAIYAAGQGKARVTNFLDGYGRAPDPVAIMLLALEFDFDEVLGALSPASEPATREMQS